ncbi:MAG: HD domain-containing protein [Parcubacteria group bacterium]|nr:HD domain-containing protein [Parcubacteria group bacterium]MCR4343011.1 HD domain-containing protein [Patescibacteria group bacterium]
MNNKDLGNITNFLFEVGMLAKTPRSGFFFLGSGEQSVAEHINRVSYIGFVLASMDKSIDASKVMKMCLFHDLAETRISDLNYVHQKYIESKEDEALKDLTKPLPFGEEIKETIKEYEDRETKEAKLAKDADILELLLSLKEQVDIGNERAKTWIPSLIKRFLTEEAKMLAEVIVKTDSDDWWFGDKDDGWWVNRNKN